MCIERMRELIFNPHAAIARSKREKGVKKTVEILLAEYAIIGLAIFISTYQLGASVAGGIALSLAVVGVIVTLFASFLIQTAMGILRGRTRDNYDALRAAVNGKFPVAVGFFIASALIGVSVLGLLPAFLIGIVFVLIGITTFVRSLMEFFGTDAITAWIAVGLTVLSIIAAGYMVGVSLVGPGVSTAMNILPWVMHS